MSKLTCAQEMTNKKILELNRRIQKYEKMIKFLSIWKSNHMTAEINTWRDAIRIKMEYYGVTHTGCYENEQYEDTLVMDLDSIEEIDTMIESYKALLNKYYSELSKIYRELSGEKDDEFDMEE